VYRADVYRADVYRADVYCADVYCADEHCAGRLVAGRRSGLPRSLSPAAATRPRWPGRPPASRHPEPGQCRDQLDSTTVFLMSTGVDSAKPNISVSFVGSAIGEWLMVAVS
jgi:hypothetical protein